MYSSESFFYCRNMLTYYTIHDMKHSSGTMKRLVAICHSEQQAYECYKTILHRGRGLTYVVLERVETDDIGLVVSQTQMKAEWTSC